MLRPFLASCLAAFFVAACGGSNPPPKPAESQAGSDAGDLAKVDEAAWADAGLTVPPESSSDGGAAAGAASSPGPKAAAAEPEDECTPVGVDFEKRARPSLKACYREGKKKDPNLEGTVRLTVNIDVKGRVKSMKITEKTLPDAVANCMLKALKATPFPDASKCPEKVLTIPMTFPTPH